MILLDKNPPGTKVMFWGYFNGEKNWTLPAHRWPP